MKVADVQKAIIRWRKYDERSQLIPKDFFEFATLIGHPYEKEKYGSGSQIVDINKPEVRNIIDLINGPNGNAILKILEIRHNDRNEQPDNGATGSDRKGMGELA